MTPEQIRWLTWGAIQHRPSGAPKWDEPGTHKAIADHCGSWGLEVATEHVLAHARDAKARTPFAIKGNAPNNKPGGEYRFPPRPGVDEECRYHRGEYADACRACQADRLAGDPPPEPWSGPLATTEQIRKHTAHLRALRDETTADLCSHGVKRANCLDHRRDTETETNQPKEGEQ